MNASITNLRTDSSCILQAQVLDYVSTVQRTVKKFENRGTYSHNKLSNLAKQHNELLGPSFMAQCEVYYAECFLSTRLGVIDNLP